MRKMWIGQRIGLVAALAVVAGLLVWGCADREKSTAALETSAAPATSAVRYHAAFAGKEGQAVHGSYRIENHGGDLRLVLDDAFKSDSGPDLHVVLSPAAPGEASGSTAMAGGEAFVVGKLGALTGQQTYDLPDDLDFSAYQSVLIQCIKYSHLYAAAALE